MITAYGDAETGRSKAAAGGCWPSRLISRCCGRKSTYDCSRQA